MHFSLKAVLESIIAAVRLRIIIMLNTINISSLKIRKGKNKLWKYTMKMVFEE